MGGCTLLSMGESDELQPFEEASDGIRETSWERERQTPEFQSINDDLDTLRHEIGERKPAFTLTQEGPIADMAYDTTFHLLSAAAEILIDPDVIGDPDKSPNTGREFVLQDLARVL